MLRGDLFSDWMFAPMKNMLKTQIQQAGGIYFKNGCRQTAAFVEIALIFRNFML